MGISGVGSQAIVSALPQAAALSGGKGTANTAPPKSAAPAATVGTDGDGDHDGSGGGGKVNTLA